MEKSFVWKHAGLAEAARAPCPQIISGIFALTMGIMDNILKGGEKFWKTLCIGIQPS